jgi:actin related protein 2/3 complex subunit 5
LNVIATHPLTPTSLIFHIAKMSEYAFRKIDIDALDEDVLSPSDLYDPDPRGPDGVLSDAKQRSNDARGLVSK